jgi:hypothetical protein
MKLTRSDFKVGMRVEYVSGQYGTSESNPLKGTRHHCLGTVTDIDVSIYVAWDNGTHNDYSPSALEIVHDNNPNYLFKVRKKKCRVY